MTPSQREKPKIDDDYMPEGGLINERWPVIKVSWQDAQDYCAWLSEETGERYRLPSDAEWEFACRAGTTTAFWWGNTISTQQANYHGDFVYNGGAKGMYRMHPVPVDEFEPNPFGLYQMHGNVWEWTSSVYKSRGFRVRGGAWCNAPENIRSATCFSWFDSAQLCDLGFRLVRD